MRIATAGTKSLSEMKRAAVKNGEEKNLVVVRLITAEALTGRANRNLTSSELLDKSADDR